MSVIIETTLGDITVDLFVKERPRACLNFLKLCKIKYYNFCVFHSVQRNFVAQTGDPTGTGRGGESIYRCIYGDQAKYFDAEKTPKIKHSAIGTISMVNDGNDQHGSQFLITLSEALDYLDGVHTVFGQVAEGEDVLLKINETFCDKDNRPYQDIRITHTVILDDPLDDLAGMVIPERSPEPTKEQVEGFLRIAADEVIDDNQGLDEHEVVEKEQRLEASHQAQVLEIIGDLPDKDVKPPDNVLFVCKLNSVTTDEDLEVIFSRFGKILCCEIIRDFTTKESLQYAFIEFENPEECEKAYLKMDNVLIDDRRIHVDFSQSVSLAKYRRHNDPTHIKESRTEDKDGRRKTKQRGSPSRKQHKKEVRGEYRDRKRNTEDRDSDKEIRCGKHSKRRSHSSDISKRYDDDNRYHKQDFNSKNSSSKHSYSKITSKHKKKSYKHDR